MAAVTYSGDAVNGTNVTVTSGKAVEITYKVRKLTNYSVEVLKCTSGIEAKPVSGNKLSITASENVEKGDIVILYYNANQTITSVLNVTVKQPDNQ